MAENIATSWQLACPRFQDIRHVIAIELVSERFGLATSMVHEPHKILECRLDGLNCHVPNAILFDRRNEILGYRLDGPTNHVPNAILFDGDGNLYSLGYEAEYKYAYLKSCAMDHDWFFFRRLDFGKNQRSVVDINGRRMDSSKIYTAVIRRIYESFINLVEGYDVNVVLIIPGCPDSEAQRCVRRAAENAGIRSDNLNVLTRSKAQLTSFKNQFERVSKCDTLIIIDLEEYTACINVYKRQGDGTFSLLDGHRRDLTACSYKQRMRQWWIDILGKDADDEIWEELLEFDNQLTRTMRSVRSQTTTPIPIRVPILFLDLLYKRKSTAMPFDGKFVRDRLLLPITFYESLWEPYLQSVISVIVELVQNNELQGHSTESYITGSIALCELVTKPITDVISKNLPGTIVTIAELPALTATLRGGVIYGHLNQQSSNGKLKHTYYVVTGMLLKPIYVHGQQVLTDPATIKIIVPIKPGQYRVELHVIATERNRPLFEDPTTDKRVGTFDVYVSSSAQSRKISFEINLHVVGFRLIVTAKNLVTKEAYTKALPCNFERSNLHE